MSKSSGSGDADQIFQEEQAKVIVPRAGIRQVYLLGVIMKLGGCTMSWNYGLAMGFWQYFIVVMTIAVGYLMLGLCMAEMLSLMTFDGGYYGYARIILGPFGGFLVGSAGLLESIFYFADYPLKIGQFVQICFDLDTKYERVVWVAVYLVLLGLMSWCTKYFWQAVSLYSVCVLLLVMIYLFGSMPHLDFDKYALRLNYNGFNDDYALFLRIFRLSFVFFIGFDLITLISAEVKDSKTAMPKAMIASISTIVLLATWLMFTVASQSPGVTDDIYQPETYFPLVFGYMRILGVSYRTATAMSVVPSIGSCIAYMYVIARQFRAMAESGLLPEYLTYHVRVFGEEVPLVTYGVICVCALGANFFAWYVDVYTTSLRVAATSGCFIYLSMFYCYVRFQQRFGHMERQFKSPLGNWGALIGAIIFLTALVMILGWPYHLVISLVFGYVGVMALYYYFVAESKQFFSASEQKIFFKAYIMNLQQRKKKTVWQKFLMDVKKAKTSLYRYFGWSCQQSDGTVIYPSNVSSSPHIKGPPRSDGGKYVDSTKNSSMAISSSEMSDTALFQAVPDNEAPVAECEAEASLRQNHSAEDENKERTVTAITLIQRQSQTYSSKQLIQEHNPRYDIHQDSKDDEKEDTQTEPTQRLFGTLP